MVLAFPITQENQLRKIASNNRAAADFWSDLHHINFWLNRLLFYHYSPRNLEGCDLAITAWHRHYVYQNYFSKTIKFLHLNNFRYTEGETTITITAYIYQEVS